jgi:hypothetical protein
MTTTEQHELLERFGADDQVMRDDIMIRGATPETFEQQAYEAARALLTIYPPASSDEGEALEGAILAQYQEIWDELHETEQN